MCQRPCWPTPEEAKALIDAGFGPRLRADYWVGGGPDDSDILVLSGALAGKWGDYKPSWPHEPGKVCTFFKQGKCQLHNLDLKPLEGALAIHGGGAGTGKELHEDIAQMWNNPEAQRLAAAWVEQYSARSGA